MMWRILFVENLYHFFFVQAECSLTLEKLFCPQNIFASLLYSYATFLSLLHNSATFQGQVTVNVCGTWVKLLCAFQRCSQCYHHPVCLILGVFVFIKSFLFCCLWSPKLSPSSQMCCILTWSRCCLCISAQMGMDAATPVTLWIWVPRTTLGTPNTVTFGYLCWNSVFFFP